DLGAGVLEEGDTLSPKLFDLLRHAVDAVFLRNADLHALHRLAERGLVVWHGQVNGGRVLRVDARHRLQHDRGIAHVTGDRPGLVERRGKRDGTPARAAAIGGLDADGAGEGSRLADRAAGIGRGGTGAQMRGNGCGRTAGGAAGHQLLVRTFGTPRVDHRAVMRGLVGGAHGELVHVQLAEHDGTVVPEVPGDGRFVFRLEAVEDVTTGLGVHPFGREQVLDAERNALERAALAGAEALVGGLSHRDRLFRRD